MVSSDQPGKGTSLTTIDNKRALRRQFLLAPVIAGAIVGGYALTRDEPDAPRSDRTSAIATADPATRTR